MKIEIRNINSLSDFEMNLMNKWMEKEFGKKNIRDFKKHYSSPDSKCFFIKEENEIVAFGIIYPINADYLGKKYSFFGIGDIVTICRGKGYGRIIVGEIINYLKKIKKTGLGFCRRKNTLFYKKVGLNTINDFMMRFRYKNPKTGEISEESKGDGLFYSESDFIKDILKTDELVYLDRKLW